MDTPSERKSLYEASNTDVFIKNFLVGFGRGVGGFAVQMLLFFVVYIMFIYTIMPKIQPLLNLLPNSQTQPEKDTGVLDRFIN